MNNILTVSQVNGYLKSVIDEDVNIKSIFVSGEISNFTNHIKTGHYYFTLKDEKSAIKAVMFRGNAMALKFVPENGMKVIVFGSVNLYERDGICQIICADMQPEGLGALYMAFEQLKEKLGKMGLFDESHKKPLPTLPKKIGVVTAKTGAAIQDIFNVLSRRYPIGEVVLFPSLVQGENAPVSICEGIKNAEKYGVDVLIVGRGGGSIEDLWAFNDERVAYAIYNSEIPIISAVGHEVDFTIADFVADLRAPTPSAAAELVAPDVTTLLQNVNTLKQRAINAAQSKIREKERELDSQKERLLQKSPEASLEKSEKVSELLKKSLYTSMEYLMQKKFSQFLLSAEKLESLSPLKVLTRGYSITFSDDKPISSVSEIKENDIIKTRFADGTICSTVTKIER